MKLRFDQRFLALFERATNWSFFPRGLTRINILVAFKSVARLQQIVLSHLILAFQNISRDEDAFLYLRYSISL